MVIIGIAGGSGSGKTSIVKELIRRLPVGSTQIIPQDNYYRDLAHLSAEERMNVNFDHPDSLEFDLLVNDLNALRNGDSVEIPTYSFADHNRSKETKKIQPAEYIIIDGILIFTHEALRNVMDYRVYVDMDEATRLSRRLRRDIEERGRTEADVLRQFEETVTPMHNQFIEPSKYFADFVIPGVVADSTGLDMLLAVMQVGVEA